MISKIKNILKLLSRTLAKRELKSKQKPTRIIISPGCGRGGSRKTKIVICSNNLSEKKLLKTINDLGLHFTRQGDLYNN